MTSIDKRKPTKIPIRANQPIGITLIDRDFSILWANEYQQARFPASYGKKKCYQISKNFTKPCSWCPIKKVTQDGCVHTALSPGVQLKNENKLAYSQIITFPYQYGNGAIRSFLEISLDLTDDQDTYFQRTTEVYPWCLLVSDALTKAIDQSIPTILLFGLVAPPGPNFDEVELLSLADGSDPIDPLVTTICRLSSRTITEADLAYFKSESADLESFAGKIGNKCIHRRFDHPLSHLINSPQRVLESNMPVRLTPREFGFYLLQNGINIRSVLVVRHTESNSFLLDHRLMELALFLSSINGTLANRDTVSRMQNANKNLQLALSKLASAEPMLDIIPLTIGKVHDITTIHISVRAAVKLLRDLSDFKTLRREAFREIIRDLNISVDKLKNLIDSIQSIAKLSKITRRNIKLEPILTEIAQLYRNQLDNDHIALEIKVQGDIELTCDPALISQVFQNLMTNSIRALRLVSRRKKMIRISAAQTEQSVSVGFFDNGIGIPDYEMNLIWEKFFSTRERGTGLGLWFARHVVENVHGGNIKVESEWGKSTEFFLDFKKGPTKISGRT